MNITAASRGRERTCNQCGAIYRSTRSTALYCSTPCRKKAARGTAPTGGPKAGPHSWSILTKVLARLGFVGLVGPVSRRDTSQAVYALLVDSETAYTELALQFDHRGWGIVSREEFAAAMRADGIQGFSTRSPEAAERKQWLDRQRQRETRQLEARAA